MIPTTRRLYQAAGYPPMHGDVSGRCATCGENGTGVAFSQWVRDTFNDYNYLHSGEIVCHACLFCFDERASVLQERMGKEKPQRMRTYSHFVVDGIWYPLSKAHKRQMRDFLAAMPDVAVIADSGQKHILFKARPGRWQFEEQSLEPQPARLGRILGVTDTLYQAGASKSEIQTGNYKQKTLMTLGVEAIREAEEQLCRERGSALFELAIFLTRKEDYEGDK